MKWFSRIFSDSSDNTSGELNAFLGAGTRFTGHLEFEGTVRIDGHFQGTIRSDGTLVLGREAVIKGEAEIGSLNANGTFVGTLRATRHAHFHEHAVFDGHLSTPAIGMDDGAIINGAIDMPRRKTTAEPALAADRLEALDPAQESDIEVIPTLPTATTTRPTGPDSDNEDGG